MLRCKLYRRGGRVSLSDVLPMFESLGLTVTDERPYEVTPRDGEPAWIYDFGLLARGADVDARRDPLALPRRASRACGTARPSWTASTG